MENQNRNESMEARPGFEPGVKKAMHGFRVATPPPGRGGF